MGDRQERDLRLGAGTGDLRREPADREVEVDTDGDMAHEASWLRGPELPR